MKEIRYRPSPPSPPLSLYLEINTLYHNADHYLSRRERKLKKGRRGKKIYSDIQQLVFAGPIGEGKVSTLGSKDK